MIDVSFIVWSKSRPVPYYFNVTNGVGVKCEPKVHGEKYLKTAHVSLVNIVFEIMISNSISKTVKYIT